MSNSNDSNEKISTIGIVVSQDVIPTDKSIDVLGLQRAAGFKEGYAAGIEAAAQFIEETMQALVFAIRAKKEQ